MSTSAARAHKVQPEALAVEADCTSDALRVRLADGREVSVPLEWFPRLRDATPEQRRRWRLIGGGGSPLGGRGRGYLCREPARDAVTLRSVRLRPNVALQLTGGFRKRALRTRGG